MLQSLLPRPHLTFNNPNAMSMKIANRDHDEDADSPVAEPSFKRLNSGRNFSGEKTVESGEGHEEEQSFESEPESEGKSECVAMDNLDFSNNLLPEITELLSPYDTSSERVGAYFA